MKGSVDKVFMCQAQISNNFIPPVKEFAQIPTKMALEVKLLLDEPLEIEYEDTKMCVATLKISNHSTYRLKRRNNSRVSEFAAFLQCAHKISAASISFDYAVNEQAIDLREKIIHCEMRSLKSLDLINLIVNYALTV